MLGPDRESDADREQSDASSDSVFLNTGAREEHFDWTQLQRLALSVRVGVKQREDRRDGGEAEPIDREQVRYLPSSG